MGKKIRNLNVELSWNVYSSPDRFPHKAGIYMVLGCDQTGSNNNDHSSCAILDIGQTGDVDERFDYHERRSCWESEARNTNACTLVYKFAEMPSMANDKNQYEKSDRMITECCLRFHAGPLPCGEECNEAYVKDDIVSIRNTGNRQPLKEHYPCGPNTKSRKKGLWALLQEILDPKNQ